MLTAERVREVLNYDPETGVFTWRHSQGRMSAGSVAGNMKKSGQVYIMIDCVRFLAHRVAWLHTTGKWPPHDIDHINGNPSDNRLKNLRPATKSQNQGNRKISKHSHSGIKGVSLHRQSGKWRARISTGGEQQTLGYFANEEDASRAYVAAAERKFGEFACDGRRN